METLYPTIPLRRCGSCHRELPVTEFYTNKRTVRIDNYCKECRRKFSANRYRFMQFGDDPASYPLITATADAAQRMALIRHAREVVRNRIAQRFKRLREEEAAAFSLTDDLCLEDKENARQ